MRKFEYTEQLPLLTPSDESQESRDISCTVRYNHLGVSKSTFKSGLALKVHKWFRLTPSFGPDLVQKMLCKMGYKASDKVLDPFSGAGTTMIECQTENIQSVGIEINPFLHWIGSASLEWDMKQIDLKNSMKLILESFRKLDKEFDESDFESGRLTPPLIHNPFRWWRPDVLKKALLLKRSIESTARDIKEKNFFLLALAGVLVPDLSNVTLGKLQLHFIDRSNDDINVEEIFTRHAEDMISDIAELSESGEYIRSKIVNGNSTAIIDELIGQEINCVVTSPPYPNRYSYVWNTRPHLFFFDFMSAASEASALDKDTIGGTWGTATSMLGKGMVQPSFKIIEDIISPTVEEIRKEDNLMANYVMKYFNLLAQQIVTMDRYLHREAKTAYVVGCSKVKGSYIETDVLLGKIFEGLGLGYKVVEIDRFRKRHSGKDLYESVVYCRK